MAEINYLCVHKTERSTKIAALLISEVTRRVNKRDKWQAVILFLSRFIHLVKIYQLPSRGQPTTTDPLTLRNWLRLNFQHWLKTKPYQWSKNCIKLLMSWPLSSNPWTNMMCLESPNFSTRDLSNNENIQKIRGEVPLYRRRCETLLPSQRQDHIHLCRESNLDDWW